jgi:hypothetical protein
MWPHRRNRRQGSTGITVGVMKVRTASVSMALRPHSCGYQENISEPTFRRNTSILYLQGPRIRQTTSACYQLHAVFLLGSFFDPEGGGDMFVWNVGYIPEDGLILLGLCTFMRLLTLRDGDAITPCTFIREVLGSRSRHRLSRPKLLMFSSILLDKRWDST